MATVNVYRLDDEMVRCLKLRAAKNNRSLESEARHIHECASEDDVATKRESFRALAARLRHGTKGRAQTLSERLIRNDRDSGTVGKPGTGRIRVSGSPCRGLYLRERGTVRSCYEAMGLGSNKEVVGLRSAQPTSGCERSSGTGRRNPTALVWSPFQQQRMRNIVVRGFSSFTFPDHNRPDFQLSESK